MATILEKTKLIVTVECKKLKRFNDILKKFENVGKTVFDSPLEHVCFASVETTIAYVTTFLLKKSQL